LLRPIQIFAEVAHIADELAQAKEYGQADHSGQDWRQPWGGLAVFSGNNCFLVDRFSALSHKHVRRAW
jgi:hypothetical protein